MLKKKRSRRIPALLTTASMRPKWSRAHCTMRPALSHSATLSVLATASPPAARMASTTVCAGPASRPSPLTEAPMSFTTTRAPLAAMASAKSRPMPPPAPVTTTTFPSSIAFAMARPFSLRPPVMLAPGGRASAGVNTARPKRPGGGETMFRPGTHNWNAQQRVIYGRAAADAVDEEARAAAAERVLISTTRSLTGGELFASVVLALGGRCIGKFDAIRAHTPRESVLAGAEQARMQQADLIVAIGGGSVIDCAKAMLLCLWRGARRGEDMERLLEAPLESSAWDADPQRLRMLAVPTTLSAAEFSSGAGVTDVARQRKQRFEHPLIVPKSVVLDPVATLDTPQALFLSSGMRAMDHAVERWLS